jgi:imidazole glycerol-phosphate synthase subunit HisH
MSKKIVVVDYGIGNIFSVLRALEHAGASPELSGDPDEIRSADRVVLPGVGAFANGMEGLRSRGLVEPIREFAKTGKPLLGICLGMQMLVDQSEEFGNHEGLGLIPGKVVEIEAKSSEGKRLKVPHIGWSPLTSPNGDWSDSPLRHVPEGSSAYFVHSFTVVPAEEPTRLADTAYGDCRISAAIRKDNVSGCQFHPEKSGEVGLQIIRNFVSS